MKRSLRNSLVVGGLAALAGATWILKTGGSVSEAAPPVVQPKSSPETVRQGAPDPEQQKKLLAAVEKVVAQRNYEAQQQRRDFEAAGWEVTQGGPPPDDKLVGYDPSLLKDRERELREQIASTTARPEDAKNLAAIAVSGKELETRWSAVEGLYRIAGDAGQPELYKLLAENQLKSSDEARSLIAPRLQPASIHDEYAANIARLLDSPTLSQVEKIQIATTLAIVSLREGATLDESVLATLSPAARLLYAQRIEWVKTELPKAWANGHGHEHEGR